MTLRLYLDEQVDVLLSALLARDGIDVLTTQEAGLANIGNPDEAQLIFATKTGRAIVTHNSRDFAAIASEWADAGREHAGIILCPQRPASAIRDGIRRLADLYPDGIPNICLGLPTGPRPP